MELWESFKTYIRVILNAIISSNVLKVISDVVQTDANEMILTTREHLLHLQVFPARCGTFLLCL